MRALAVLVLPLVFACSAATPRGDLLSGPVCAERVEFDAPAPLPNALPSRLTVRATVDEALLLRAIERAVPRVLASAQGRSVGAPGKVSYEVRRRGLRLEPRPDGLVVRTQLDADIQVCKPLGPMCLHYGACQPEWAVEVRVPLPLTLNAPPRPTLGLALTRGCVLRPVGYDATSELERLSNEQARTARAEIQRRLNAVHERVVATWQTQRRGLRYGAGAEECLRVEPISLAHTPISRDDAGLALGLTASAHVTLGCQGLEQPVPEPYEGGPPPFPETELVDEVDGDTRLVVVHDLPFTELAASLAEHPNLKGRSLTLVSGTRDGKVRLVAGVRGGSECAVQWVLVEPVLHAKGITLRPVSEANTEATRALAQSHASLPSALAHLATALPEFRRRMLEPDSAELAGAGLRLEAPLSPVLEARIGPEALQVELGLEGSLAVVSETAATP